MISAEFEDMVIKSVRQMLPTEKPPTIDMIQAAVSGVVEMMRIIHKFSDIESIDRGLLARKIEALCNVSVPNISTLDDMSDHLEWFSARRAEIQWRFWERYRSYLENNADMPLQAIRRLDDVTNQILGRLEDPSRPASWDRRGMVVGQVQSGKTSNYTALICKAADAGYKLIIVLAGIHNSLRSQTQLRLDEGFLGFDTQKRRLFNPNNSRLGVGLLPGIELYRVQPLTSSHETGDFNLRFARQTNLMIRGAADPILLVVKKNASVLKNLWDWCTQFQSGDQGDAQSIVNEVPLLLIDDEADNASINTNSIRDENGTLDPELDPSKINGWIRKLLNSFAQSAYVAYTATPFANIFIPEKAKEGEYGEDLFPRSFIINLQPPSNYVSPIRLFGLEGDQETTSSLPLIRPVNDYTSWLPDKHKKDYQPGSLPPSVQEAIKAFILTCAVRYVRGKIYVHNSMLIHVTRFTAVQSAVFNQVKGELEFLQERLRYGDGDAPRQIIAELKDLWIRDFEPTMKRFREPDLTPVIWDQIKDVLYKVASKIEVRIINGTARDALQYVDHKDKGLSVICIGGDKLSRGLTLEGLSVSYYLRTSKMYDTLMQMGRWFGYRNGYVDVCRLYTTRMLESRYRNITASDEELRLMFEDMAAQEKTPQDYGLGVKTHPEGLLITDRSKMQAGRKLLLSYSQRITETVAFFADPTTNHQNLNVTERMIQKINAEYMQRNTNINEKNYIWHGVHGEVIIDFLNGYRTHRTARTARSSMLSKYIKARIADRELIDWTIALISVERNVRRENSYRIAGLPVGLVKRELTGDGSNSRYSIGRLVSPRDEAIDLSPEEYDQALRETKKRWKEKPGRAINEPELPSGMVIREVRPATRGLLLLYLLISDSKISSDLKIPIVGLAISFPKSERGAASAVEYMVNETYWQQVLEEDEL
jgi:Z1 domain